MTYYNWQPNSAMNAIVFDCDGTLSAIEGINELARVNNVEAPVKALTEDAMRYSGINLDLYRQRLNLVLPHRQQIIDLGFSYHQHCVPGVKEAIQVLQRLGKSIYVVSAGLYPAVKIFAEQLAIPSSNIFAVDVHFDQHGNYVDFDMNSPLVQNMGKREIVTQLKKYHQTIIHIGDGMNDFVAADLATRFIGYGGVFYRANLALQAAFYIKSLSMLAILPLILTDQERAQLKEDELKLYEQGMLAIQENEVIIQPD